MQQPQPQQQQQQQQAQQQVFLNYGAQGAGGPPRMSQEQWGEYLRAIQQHQEQQRHQQQQQQLQSGEQQGSSGGAAPTEGVGRGSQAGGALFYPYHSAQSPFLPGAPWGAPNAQAYHQYQAQLYQQQQQQQQQHHQQQQQQLAGRDGQTVAQAQAQAAGRGVVPAQATPAFASRPMGPLGHLHGRGAYGLAHQPQNGRGPALLGRGVRGGPHNFGPGGRGGPGAGPAGGRGGWGNGRGDRGGRGRAGGARGGRGMGPGGYVGGGGGYGYYGGANGNLSADVAVEQNRGPRSSRFKGNQRGILMGAVATTSSDATRKTDAGSADQAEKEATSSSATASAETGSEETEVLGEAVSSTDPTPAESVNHKETKADGAIADAPSAPAIPPSVAALTLSEFNRSDMTTSFAPGARFFVIKSYSEDDVHKSVKYGVWASTPGGNRRLDAAFSEAQGKQATLEVKGEEKEQTTVEVKTEEGEKANSEGDKEDGVDHRCPVFLFFSVNASGQFCGVAEMTSSVDFAHTCDVWQQDKWAGRMQVQWRVVKDVPNSQFRHITLPNNEGKPVTNSRDTQEIEQSLGQEMLRIFKNYSARTSILDDFEFYDSREVAMKERRSRQQQQHNYHAQKRAAAAAASKAGVAAGDKQLGEEEVGAAGDASSGNAGQVLSSAEPLSNGIVGGHTDELAASVGALSIGESAAKE